MKTTKYDYLKYVNCNFSSYKELSEKEFFGLHEVNGRIEIDVERYKEACEIVGIKDFMPKELFDDESIKYFIPKKKSRYDYMVNVYLDSLLEFISNWNQEYKPLFKNIMTPSDVEDSYRTNALMYTSCSDDYDDISIEARLEGFRRIEQYNRIINELYCLFINKVCTEVDRISLLAMTKAGFTGIDFSFKEFKAFSEGLLNGQKVIDFTKLKKYNAYNMLHKINNFLKHNSVESYMTLKKLYPDNVASIENGKAKFEYENGMFAYDWIILKPNYIDDVLVKLQIFFKDYCFNYYGEDSKDAEWNHDDYFLNAVREMSNPAEYYGLPY